MRIKKYQKNGLTFMKSDQTPTAEQVVEELNLLGELDLPLFSNKLKGGSNDQRKMSKVQTNKISDQTFKDREPSSALSINMS
jgi:hypothetical protein